MITVVGQCIGAGRPDEAQQYTGRLLKMVYISHIALNAVIFACLNLIVQLYGLQEETATVAKNLMIMYGIGACTIWPPSFALPNALRAAGDVKYTMIVSIISMWVCRILMSLFMGNVLGWQIYGVWCAMFLDWICRGTCFVWRILKGPWKSQKTIS